MKTEMIRARVSPALKHDSEEILAQLGMTPSDAIRMFLNQVVVRKEFPVELKVPNEVTLKAMAEPLSEDSYDSIDDLFDEVLNGENEANDTIQT